MLKTRRKLLIGTFISALVVSLSLFSLWQLYIYPKLSLFDDDKRAENFRSMFKIFPSKSINHSQKPYYFKESIRQLDISYKFKGKQHQMSELLKRTGTTGILVIKDDVIVYEEYFQGYKQTDKNTSWSMAKSFLSALVGIAVQEGYIKSINDPITKYVPELASSGYKNVPIKDILQMSSGVKFSEDYDDPSSDINQLLSGLFVEMKSLKKVILAFPSKQPSGKNFHYISLDSQVLGILLERVTKQDFVTYFQNKLWQPMGAENKAYWLTDNYGTPLSFCCLNSTLRDYAKFGLLYLHNGNFNGQQVISQKWVKESTVPDKPYLQPGATSQEYDQWGYQYQWWIPTGSDGDYVAVGVWGQYMYINKEKKLVIVKTSSGFSTMTTQDDDEVIALFRTIADNLK